MTPTDVELWVICISCSLSFLGAIFIIASWLMFEDQRVFARRIIVYMSLGDLGVTAAFTLAVILPQLENTILDRTLYEALCQVQGYILLFSQLSSFTWTACFASHLYLLVSKKVENLRRHHIMYHIITILVPMSVCSYYLILSKQYGIVTMGNFDRPWNWLDPSLTMNGKNSVSSSFLDNGAMQQVLFVYLPYIAILLYNIVIYSIVAYNVNGTSLGVVIQRRMFAYIFGLLFCGGFSACNRIYTVYYIYIYIYCIYYLTGSLYSILLAVHWLGTRTLARDC